MNLKAGCFADSHSLRLGLYKCPKCGTSLEIFSDEDKIRCYKCGDMVYRRKLTPCVDWFASAQECVGVNELRRCKHD